MSGDERKADKCQVSDGNAVGALKILAAFALAVDVGVAIQLGQVVIAVLPMKLALRYAMHLGKNVLYLQVNRGLDIFELAYAVDRLAHRFKFGAIEDELRTGPDLLLGREKKLNEKCFKLPAMYRVGAGERRLRRFFRVGL